MSIKKVVFSFIGFLLLLIFVFLNLGKWIDVTEEAVKSDIIVCLGGGTIDRVKKSIGLLEEGYAEKNIFLLLGESWYNQPYIKKNHPGISIVIDESPKNTKEEVLFIKQYMKKHGHESALIVTDPPHSRRVSMLLSSIINDEEIHFRIVGSDVKWWDREKYYDQLRSAKAVLNESMKIVYLCLID